MHMLVFINYWR